MPAPEPIYLAGPTAVGKSDIAAELAAQLGGEVVGADAFQVYRGLDLLTARPSPETLARVPHHLIGEVPLSERFDVNRYREMASPRIVDIAARGRVPVVAGGTGLYLRALTRGLADLPEADPALRERLQKRPLGDLQREFAALDSEGARTVDLQNPRRVIRALEVCLLTGRPFSSFREEWNEAPGFRGVLLMRERDVLRERIAQRTAAMFEAGVVEEVRRAGEIGPTAAQAIGWREIRELLAGSMNEQDCRERITLATRQYAKRQLTWFRREPALRVVEIAAGEPVGDVVARIRRDLGV
jgi:tRNA dimethylallyltransferase